MRDVDEPRARAKGRRVPVLAAWARGADVSYDFADLLGVLLLVVDEPARLKVNTLRGRDVDERIGRKNLTGRAIHHVDVAVAFGTHEDFPRLPADGHVQKDLLVDAVVVVQVVRRPLVEPERLARVGVAREDARRPPVIAGSLRGVPGAGIPRAVEDEVLFRVV